MGEVRELYRWGILGCGNIAKKMASALQACERAELYAGATRNEDRGRAFQKEFSVGKMYSTYEDLVADPNIDIIYVATPHAFHFEHAGLALKAKKAVLCEKPMVLHAVQMRDLQRLAKENNMFLMEAVWSRFLPMWQDIRQRINDGVIGELRHVQAGFCFRMPYNPEHRLFNPELGGGALLDVGIYPLTLCSYLCGEPESIHGIATLAESGVDVQNSFVLRYKSGVTAQCASAVCFNGLNRAEIVGTTGSIHLENFWKAEHAVMKNASGEEVIQHAHRCNGFEYECDHVMECLDQGLLESPEMTHAESLRICEEMDRLRRYWGVFYPGE